jgi:hypothetical protein
MDVAAEMYVPQDGSFLSSPVNGICAEPGWELRAAALGFIISPTPLNTILIMDRKTEMKTTVRMR